MARVCIVCPGRGSYTEASLGSLPRDDELVLAAERLRASYGLESLVELDAAGRFEAARHLRPANVSALIYVVSMLDGREAMGRDRAVCIVGNSMGWYTALAMGGALTFEEGFRLVQEMSLLQEDGAPGGQVIYPVVGEDWRRSPELERAVQTAVEGAPGEVFPSIRLGGYAVLAGSSAGVSRLLKELPPVKVGKTQYPFRLAQHGPYHTVLAASVAARARAQLSDLPFRRPSVPLVDGRGVRFTPWSTRVDALRDYTLGAQIETPYDFTTSVRVALREYAPERLVLPGPGNTLGGVCGQILIEEGWRGLASKADFKRVQESAAPVVSSEVV